jgi:hypothetical protein
VIDVRFLAGLCRNRDVVEITVMLVVVRCLRADVRGNERGQFPIQQIESDAAIKRRAVVVVFDTRVNALRNSRVKIDKLGCVKRA